jgi:hypothetical protein
MVFNRRRIGALSPPDRPHIRRHRIQLNCPSSGGRYTAATNCLLSPSGLDAASRALAGDGGGVPHRSGRDWMDACQLLRKPTFLMLLAYGRYMIMVALAAGGLMPLSVNDVVCDRSHPTTGSADRLFDDGGCVRACTLRVLQQNVNTVSCEEFN